jgi:hypothetical protein
MWDERWPQLEGYLSYYAYSLLSDIAPALHSQSYVFSYRSKASCWLRS